MTQLAQNAGHAALGPETSKRPVPAMVFRALASWSARRRSRIALSQLSPAQLRDIGLDRLVAEEEARRPFWQP